MATIGRGWLLSAPRTVVANGHQLQPQGADTNHNVEPQPVNDWKVPEDKTDML